MGTARRLRSDGVHLEAPCDGGMPVSVKATCAPVLGAIPLDHLCRDARRKIELSIRKSWYGSVLDAVYTND